MPELVKQTKCPSCPGSSETKYAIYDDGSTFCFKCGYTISSLEVKNKLSSNTTSFYPQGPVANIEKGKISKEVCEKFGVFVTTDTNGEKRLVFPHYKDGKLIRQKSKTKDKRFGWAGGDKNSSFEPFGLSVSNNKKRLFITEGEEDIMAVYQVLGPQFGSYTSLTDGGGAKKVTNWIKKHHNLINNYEEIVLVFDNDEVGEESREEFIKSFPTGKVSYVVLPLKDARDMLDAGKGLELKWACLNPKQYKPDGVLKISDLDVSYFNEKFEQGVRIPYPILNHYLGGLRKGELTMLASGTGGGKSTFCTNLIYDLIIDKKFTVADIKLEESQRKSIYTYLAMHSEKKPRQVREDPGIVSLGEKEKFIKDFSNLYVQDHFGSLDALNLLNILEYYAVILKVDFIFLDHISIAVSGNTSSRDGERKDIDRLVTKLRELIDRTGVGFVCISHLRNPPAGDMQWEEGRPVRRNDLRGSGSLAQLSDNIIGLEGNLTNEERKCDRTLKLIKTRYGEEQEVYCDTFTFDNKTGKIHIKEKGGKDETNVDGTFGG